MIDAFTTPHPMIIEDNIEYYHDKEFLKNQQAKFNQWLTIRLQDRTKKIQEEDNQC
jgi:hypothetical protein